MATLSGWPCFIMRLSFYLALFFLLELDDFVLKISSSMEQFRSTLRR